MKSVSFALVVVLFLILVFVGFHFGLIEFQEAFTGEGYPTKQLCTMPLSTMDPPSENARANSTLDKPREPYNLLGDYLAPAEGRLANLKSECAYIADGQRHIEKTGSYGQVTNNYKRSKPDNGTTWLHELSLSFYK